MTHLLALKRSRLKLNRYCNSYVSYSTYQFDSRLYPSSLILVFCVIIKTLTHRDKKMLIDGKKYTYKQLIEETGLSRSTLHRRIKVLKESGVPLTIGAILRFPTAWAFYDNEGNFYSSKIDYSVQNSIPYYEMFHNSKSDTKTDT